MIRSGRTLPAGSGKRRGILAAGLCLLIVDIAAMLGVARLQFDSDFERVFRTGDARFHDYAALRDAFAPLDEFLLLVSAPDLAAPPQSGALRAFVIELQLLDGMRAVLSPFSSSATGAVSAQGPDSSTGIPPDGGSALVTALAEPGRLSEADFTAIARQTLAPAGIGLSASGLPVLLAHSHGLLLSDFLRVNAMGALLGLAVAALLLRNIWMIAMAMLATGTAALWSMGMLGWLGVPINVLSIALPVLLMTLALADAVHLTLDLRQMHGAARPDPVAASLRRIGPAAGLTSLTTALAFLSLALSPSHVIAEIGFGGALAVLAACGAVLSTFWVLGNLWPAPPHTGNTSSRGPGEARLASWIEKFTRAPRALSLAAVLLAGLAALGFSRIEPRFALTENLPASDPALKTFQKIGGAFGANARIDIPVETQPGGALESARHTAAKLQAAGLDPLSLARIADENGATPEELATLREELPPELAERLFGTARGLQLVSVPFVYRNSQDTRALAREIETALATGPAGTAPERATGAYVLSAFASADMLAALARGLLAAILAGGLAVGLWLGSVRAGLIAMTVNILPVALVGAMLWLCGTGLLFAGTIALTLGFGIAMDDTIHVFNRLRLQTRAPGEWPARACPAAAGAGPAILTTTAILCAGLSGTLLAEMPTIRHLGLLSISLFLLALLADLLLLPALIKWASA